MCVSESESVGVSYNKGSIEYKKCFDEWSTMLIDREKVDQRDFDHKTENIYRIICWSYSTEWICVLRPMINLI